MSSRSIRLRPDCITTVKIALADKLRNSNKTQSRWLQDRNVAPATFGKFCNCIKVSYRNFENICQVLGINWEEVAVLENNNYPTDASKKPKAQIEDWEDAPDIPVFYGRTQELATLEEWILQDNCRLINIWGIGGIGKTALSVKLAQQIKSSFDLIVYRNVYNAPPIELILTDIIERKQETIIGETLSEKTCQFIKILQSDRCLILLDSFDSIVLENTRQEYQDLIEAIAKRSHQSCLIINSRNKQKYIDVEEGVNQPIRAMKLTGLSTEAALSGVRGRM
jgi:Cdc6-like AAA superfamily ATPase